MATTAVLHANDMHKTEQSPRSVSTTNSPLVHGYSPNQMSTYNVAGVSPAEAATASNCGSSYQQPNYPLQPSRNVYQNLTPEPPSSETASLMELGATPLRMGPTPVTPTQPPSSETASLMELGATPLRMGPTPVTPTQVPVGVDVIYVRDPFYEPPRKRTPNTQHPPQYPNTGNPMYSGGQLELPRNVRVAYPESAFEAVAAANKTFASYTSGMCMQQQPRTRPMPYMSPQQLRNAAAYGGGTGGIPNGMMSPSYTPPPQQNAMPPAYSMRQLGGCPKAGTATSQMPTAPAPYQFYPSPAGNPLPTGKKQSPLTSTKKAKQAAKAQFESQLAAAKNARKNDYTPVPVVSAVNNIYEQIPDPARPSTSTAAATYGLMGPSSGAMGGVLSSQSPSPSTPSTSQMLTSNVRNPYPYDTPVMSVPNNPGIQQFDAMRSLEGGSGMELMQPPPLPVMRPNGHMNGTKQLEGGMMGKPAMMSSPSFAQPPHEMQTDLQRMCNARAAASLKSPQYQSPSMMGGACSSSGGVSDVYGTINGGVGSSPNYMQPNVMAMQRCACCKEEFRGDRIGIQCTGNNQGCRRFFHQECSQLLPESFHAILSEPRAEWICNECVSRQQQITYS